MRNFCERICILCTKEQAGEGEVIQALPGIGEKKGEEGSAGNLAFSCQGHIPAPAARIVEAERQVIVEALELFGYHKGKTAQYLQMDKSTLWRKMKKYGISG